MAIVGMSTCRIVLSMCICMLRIAIAIPVARTCTCTCACTAQSSEGVFPGSQVPRSFPDANLGFTVEVDVIVAVAVIVAVIVAVTIALDSNRPPFTKADIGTGIGVGFYCSWHGFRRVWSGNSKCMWEMHLSVSMLEAFVQYTSNYKYK